MGMAKWKDLTKIAVGFAILIFTLIGASAIKQGIDECDRRARIFYSISEEDSLAEGIAGMFLMFILIGFVLVFGSLGILLVVYGLSAHITKRKRFRKNNETTTCN